MTDGSSPHSAAPSMPTWWRVLFLTGAVLLAAGLVATLWVADDRDPVPVSGSDNGDSGDSGDSGD